MREFGANTHGFFKDHSEALRFIYTAQKWKWKRSIFFDFCHCSVWTLNWILYEPIWKRCLSLRRTFRPTRTKGLFRLTVCALESDIGRSLGDVSTMEESFWMQLRPVLNPLFLCLESMESIRLDGKTDHDLFALKCKMTSQRYDVIVTYDFETRNGAIVIHGDQSDKAIDVSKRLRFPAKHKPQASQSHCVNWPLVNFVLVVYCCS